MRNRLVFLAVFGCLAAMLWSGCGEDGQGPGPANRPPTVELTTGPVEGETVYYSVRLEWSGSDPDGFVSRYEYALDPPPGFTEDEIAHGGPGITVERSPGSTRVSKTVEGETIFFDWIHTTLTSRRFTFSATESDSTGGTPTGRFTGMHAVYVRTVDNDDAVSEPDKVAFTAETVAPESRITRPDISAELWNLGTEFVVEWEGTDPDGAGTQEPAGYLYRVLRLDTLSPPLPLIFATAQRLYDRGDLIWTYVDGPTYSQTFEFVPGGQYLFGVRAVDEAGAVEPFLDFGRNCFKFQALADGGKPTLQICDMALGCFMFRGAAAPVEVQVGTNTPLQFEVSCSAASYGETCDSWRWGLDLPDLDTPQGWSDWIQDPVLPPIIFTVAGVHVLYVEARDAAGATTLGSIVIGVTSFTFDRDLLLVDDSKETTFPTSSESDAFWHDLIQNYPEPLDWYEFESTGSITAPVSPSVEELGRYKMVLWSYSPGYYGLWAGSTIRRTLPVYLRGGGKLWVEGFGTIESMKRLRNAADAGYNPLLPGDFAWDFMKLQSSLIESESGTTQRNLFTGVTPYPGGTPAYGTMTVDPPKLSSGQVALSHVDAVFAPILGEADPSFVGEIDSLYAYRAYGNEVSGEPSSYHGKLTALRWHDPNPDPIHGRIQWFGFPLYYMVESQAQDTFNKSLDWFREGS